MNDNAKGLAARQRALNPVWYGVCWRLALVANQFQQDYGYYPGRLKHGIESIAKEGRNERRY